jgi:hypothetical protein
MKLKVERPTANALQRGWCFASYRKDQQRRRQANLAELCELVSETVITMTGLGEHHVRRRGGELDFDLTYGDLISAFKKARVSGDYLVDLLKGDAVDD